MADAGLAAGSELTEVLLAAARRLAESIDPERVYDSFHELLDEVVPHDGVVVSSFDPHDGLIRCEYAWVEGSRIDESTLPPLPLNREGGGMQSRVIVTGKPLLENDVEKRVQQPGGTYYNVDREGHVANAALTQGCGRNTGPGQRRLLRDHHASWRTYPACGMSTWGRAFGSASVAAMEVYDEVLVPRLFTPWADVLLGELALRPGESVLDVACGPGSVTRMAAQGVGRQGRVVGCDLSAAMLAVGRAKPGLTEAAPIEYVEAPADSLPVAAESFDVAVCQQGLQFFPDRVAALSEIHRSLRPGGRAGIAVWTAIEDSPVFAAMYDALKEATGHELADRYRDGPWGLPQADQLRNLLTVAGFEDVRVDRHTVDVVFDGGPAQFASTLAASGIAAEIEALPAEQRSELLQAFDEHTSPLCRDGTLHSPTSSNLALVRR